MVAVAVAVAEMIVLIDECVREFWAISSLDYIVCETSGLIELETSILNI